MLHKDIMGFVFHIQAISPEETVIPPVPTFLTEVMDQYKEGFIKKEGLPPSRACDHRIDLKPGATPSNLRPYRVPHFQKASMEEIIIDLIKNGEIQPSVSPCSSPAIIEGNMP